MNTQQIVVVVCLGLCAFLIAYPLFGKYENKIDMKTYKPCITEKLEELYVFYIVNQTDRDSSFPQQFVVLSDGSIYWRIGAYSELISPYQFNSTYENGSIIIGNVRYNIDKSIILGGFDIAKKWYDDYLIKSIQGII